jgi:hypothetical protein
MIPLPTKTGRRIPLAKTWKRIKWIMEFRNGKVVRETQYFADPFAAPLWRSQWVQRI